jgi:hypothetical protein
MVIVVVTVTGPPEIVVVVFVQPNTDEQKLVKDTVLVFVLWRTWDRNEGFHEFHGKIQTLLNRPFLQ